MKVTIRADSVEIEGYVNAVGRDSRTLTDEYGYPFVEQIQPGTFANALNRAKEEEREIGMLLNHDAKHVIGGTDTNLVLEEDTIGLHALAQVTDPDTILAAKEKRLRGWSFGFRDLDYREEYSGGVNRRKVTELELIEVSVIDDQMIPAYAGTSIHARAEEDGAMVYVRAMDDRVDYDEDLPEQEKPDAKPKEGEVRAKEPNEAPKQTSGDSEEPLQDYSVYRNTINLLKLGSNAR